MDELLSAVLDIKIWVGIMLGLLVKGGISHTPRLIKGYLKKQRLKNFKKIRKVRVNQSEVIYEITKANSYFLFFLLACLMYILLIIIGPLGKFAQQNILLFLILIMPLYVIEVFWLLKDIYAKSLINKSINFAPLAEQKI